MSSKRRDKENTMGYGPIQKFEAMLCLVIIIYCAYLIIYPRIPDDFKILTKEYFYNFRDAARNMMDKSWEYITSFTKTTIAVDGLDLPKINTEATMSSTDSTQKILNDLSEKQKIAENAMQSVENAKGILSNDLQASANMKTDLQDSLGMPQENLNPASIVEDSVVKQSDSSAAAIASGFNLGFNSTKSAEVLSPKAEL